MLMTLTAVRDGKNILVNVNHIRRVVEDEKGYSRIIIGEQDFGDSLIHVKESLEEVKEMANDLSKHQTKMLITAFLQYKGSTRSS